MPLPIWTLRRIEQLRQEAAGAPWANPRLLAAVEETLGVCRAQVQKARRKTLRTRSTAEALARSQEARLQQLKKEIWEMAKASGTKAENVEELIEQFRAMDPKTIEEQIQDASARARFLRSLKRLLHPNEARPVRPKKK